MSRFTELFLAAGDRYELLRNFPTTVEREAEARWFETAFAKQSEANQDRFLEQAFAAIHDYQPTKVKVPVWVAEWSRLAPVLTGQADDWLRFVGCKCFPGYRQFVIVLQYGARDGMPPLFRPTQLDSGGNRLHFPLPGETDAALGGFCLSALPSLKSTYHCSREWIHCPFRWEPKFFDAAGRKWGWAGSCQPIDGPALADRRQTHRDYLQTKLGIRYSWMPAV